MHRILIAEDSELAWLLGELLRLRSYDPTVVNDGVEALEARPETFDVLVLDMHMPRLDGIGALKALRDRGVRVPVIVMSADPALRRAALGAGAWAFVLKPFNSDGFFRLVEAAAERPLRESAVAPPHAKVASFPEPIS